MLTEHKILGTIGIMSGVMSVPTPFTKAWGRLLLYTQEALCKPGEYIHPEDTDLSLHDSARNQLVQNMRGDWLLMLDTDTRFEPDFAARLVATMHRHNLDVLTGIYSYKSYPHVPILWMVNEVTERPEHIARWNPRFDIFPVARAGAGCLLVRKRVFDRIRNELKQQPFDRIGGKGEDVSFFERLKTLGITAYCNPKIEMIHLAYKEIRTSEHYDQELIPKAHSWTETAEVPG